MSTPSTILAPVTLASNNNNNKMQETNLHKLPQLQQQHLQQQHHHHALANKSAAATNKMTTPLGISSSSVGNSNDKVVAPFKPAPLSSSSPPSYAHAVDEQQQQLKATLTADLKLLSHEFERFQQSSDDEAGAAERASKVQFFLDYIDRVVSQYIYINK
jgi:hypothetical protein